MKAGGSARRKKPSSSSHKKGKRKGKEKVVDVAPPSKTQASKLEKPIEADEVAVEINATTSTIQSEKVDEGETDEEEEQQGFIEWRRDLIFKHRYQNEADVQGMGIEANEETCNLTLKATKGLSSIFKTIDADPATESPHKASIGARGETVDEDTDSVIYGRYRPTRVIGEGTFSQILEAIDLYQPHQVKLELGEEEEEVKSEVEGPKVAIKVMKLVPGQNETTLMHTKIGQQEAAWLHRIKRLDKAGVSGVVDLKSTFFFEDHYCMVLELTGPSLYKRISNQSPSPIDQLPLYHPFDLSELRKISVQVLSSLAFLHNNEIIHADIKPENIVFQSEVDETNSPLHDLKVKLIDFGNAMSVKEAQDQYRRAILNDSAPEVQSIPYRAPEVVWRNPYDTKIDMWSLGCVLFEMYTGRMLFDPSKNAPEGAKNEEMKDILDDELVLMMVDLLGSDSIAINDSSAVFSEQQKVTGKEKVKSEKTQEKKQPQSEQKRKTTTGGKKGTTTTQTEEKKAAERKSVGGNAQQPTSQQRIAKKRKMNASGMLKVNDKGELSFNQTKKRKVEEGEAGFRVVKPQPIKANRGFTMVDEGGGGDSLEAEWRKIPEENVPEGPDSFLSFKKGDVVHILERADEHHWLCLFDGRIGLASVADLELQSPFSRLQQQNSTQESKPSTQQEEDFRRRQYNYTHKKLMRLLDTTDHVFVDFVQRLLEYQPSRRLSPQEALLHPFIASFFPFLPVFSNRSYDNSFPALREFSWQEKRREKDFEEYVRGRGTEPEKESKEELEEEWNKKMLTMQEEFAAKVKEEKVKLKKKKKEKLKEMDRKMILARVSMKGVFEREMAIQLESEKEKMKKELAVEKVDLQNEVERLQAALADAMHNNNKIEQEGIETKGKIMKEMQEKELEWKDEKEKAVAATKVNLRLKKMRQRERLKKELEQEKATGAKEKAILQKAQEELKKQLEEQKRNWEEQKRVWEEQKRNWEEQRRLWEEKEKKLQQEESTLQQVLAKSQETVKTLNQDIQNISKQKEEEIEALKESIEKENEVQMNELRETMQREAEAQKKEIEAQQKSAMKKKETEWKAKLKQIDQKMAKYQMESDKALEEKNNILEKQRLQMVKLEAGKRRTKEKKKVILRNEKELKEKIEQMEEENKSINDSLEQKQEKIEGLEQRLEAAENRCKAREATLRRLKTKISEVLLEDLKEL